MNLENAVSSASAPFTFKWTPRQGIYKVIFYAKTADASVAGWKVNVKDTSGTVSTGQANALNTLTPCKAGDAATVGTNMVEIICDERLAATEVEISFSGVGPLELAEVVVVGKAWDAYPCALGYSSSNGFHANTGTGCQICANGQHESRSAFAATDTPTSCTACDTTKKIYYTNADDHKKQTTCQKCANHLVVLSTSESSSWTCVKCPAGQEYHTTGAGECTVTIDRSTAQAISVAAPENCDAVSCRVCEDGNRNPAESSTYCHRCEKKRDYTTDKINCLTCPDGQIADTAGTGCTNCAAGTYRGNADLECLPCAAGSMSGEGAAECTQCEEGKYEDSKTSCVDCPKGTYNKLAGQSGLAQCLACDDGSVATSLGLSACEVCQPGNYAKTKTEECVACEVAKYQPDPKKTTCLTCAAGTVPNDAKTQCDPCGVGEEYFATGEHANCNYSPVRSTPTDIVVTDPASCTAVGCKACEPGYVKLDSSNKYCYKCQEARQFAVGNTCLNCEAGQIADTAGTGCTNCAAGTYRGNADLDCLPCAAGSMSGEGAAECTQCEEGKYEDSKTSCVDCPKGTYNELAGQSGLAQCLACDDGSVATSLGLSACAVCQPGFYGPADKTLPCVPCETGKYQDVEKQTSCKTCPAGHVPNSNKDGCVPCPMGKIPNSDQSACESCPAGTFQPETGKAECLQCGVGKITSTEGQSVCVTCEIGQEANTARTECVDCAMGMYQPDDTGGTCTNCPVGKYSDNVKSSKCTDCAVGQFQDNEGKAGCKPCPAGQYSGEAGAATCTDCASGHVTREEGMSKCVPCQPGFKANQNSAATDCDKCDPGTYQDQTGQTQCKACLANYFSSTDGQKSCKRCEDKLYAAVKSSQCLPCPAPDNSDDPVLKEKCDNDENKGCASAKYENQYGNFSHNWLEEDESADGKCGFDENQAVFKCKMIEGQLQVEETYYCKKSIKTEEIAGLAESDATAEEKTEKLVDLTEDTAMNGLGDMEAVSNVLKSIGISNETDGNNDVQPIDKKVTETILKSVSNLVQSDFKVASNETKEASDISAGVVNQVINVVKQTEVKNKVIKSPRLAVIDIKKDKDDAPAKKGIVAFSLPSSDRNSKSKGLQNCSIANEDDKEDTFLMIETKEGQNNAEMDMAVVLITDATLMPDAKISIIKQEETDQDDDTVKQILEDLKKDMEDKAAAGSSETPKKKYVNSFITEISVENPPEDFKLNLFMKPTVDIGNSSQSLNTESSGKRVEVTYICAKYVPEEMTWKEDCETIYDKARPSAGVLCLCDHNTSFAVLMSAYEIDRGYAQVQSYLTYVLLGLSTVGLLLTLVFLLPAKALRSTRSAKINICFTTALLLSSLLFLIQDAFVNAEDTGIIKLKSVGCAVYAMLQHYLWLVVFSWMVVEGFLMYLSLVQVFGSHISKYMLKFNLAAWGIPLPIPFIGYFVFTKEHTVGSFTFTDHGYLADTMCFIKPESIPFYALFLAPIVLVILINLVFFALVAKVIKNSKSSGNISDQEQILRQLKAAVGVMVLLGTGWFFGIFMSVPTPQFQVGMQYLFILLNGTQGMFVFLFYIVLNDQVKTHWLVKMGFQEEKKATTSSSAAGKSTATKATTVSVSASQNQADNIYENAAASNEEHTYASAEYATAGDKAKKHEFPAKSDNNANI